ncbi:Lichenase [Platanthera guangdongensis]|uniref:Lichenase n=1 Tax=Platanthera guangdongensis TaxID=2320717 RepID=A0ABR2M8A6_9ASPA
MQANNLPSPSQVISLCKSRNIQKLRLYGSNPAVLAGLRNSDIGIILGADEQDLQQLSWDPAAVGGWVQANIIPYVGSVNFQYIVMGNEEIPSRPAPSLATSFPPYATLPAPCRPLASPFRSPPPSPWGCSGQHSRRRKAFSRTKHYSSVLGKHRLKEGKQMNLLRRLLRFQPPALRNAPKSSVWSSHLPPPIQTLRFHPPDQPATAELKWSLTLDYALFRAKGTVVQDDNLGY